MSLHVSYHTNSAVIDNNFEEEFVGFTTQSLCTFDLGRRLPSAHNLGTYSLGTFNMGLESSAYLHWDA